MDFGGKTLVMRFFFFKCELFCFQNAGWNPTEYYLRHTGIVCPANQTNAWGVCCSSLFCFNKSKKILFFLTGWAFGPRVGSFVHSWKNKFILGKFIQQIYLLGPTVYQELFCELSDIAMKKKSKNSVVMGLVWHTNIISKLQHLVAIGTVALENGEARWWGLQTDALGSNFRQDIRESLSLGADFEQRYKKKEKLMVRGCSGSPSCFGQWSQGICDSW